MKLIALFFVLAAPVFAGEWVSLFDGKTMTGWTNQGNADWKVEDGTLTASEGDVCLLTTDKTYENYVLELEFKAAKGTNSGVFLNTEAKVKNEAVDCYEINIADPTNPFPTGSIVKHHRIEGQGETDDWRSYRLIVNKGSVTVELDGKHLVTYSPKNPRPAGLIGLQKNAGKIAFRKIRVKELD
ncbi:MAG: 3-keto-disaccharide hydrolase [Verrucomicrobiaceae bacterium]